MCVCVCVRVVCLQSTGSLSLRTPSVSEGSLHSYGSLDSKDSISTLTLTATPTHTLGRRPPMSRTALRKQMKARRQQQGKQPCRPIPRPFKQQQLCSRQLARLKPLRLSRQSRSRRPTWCPPHNSLECKFVRWSARETEESEWTALVRAIAAEHKAQEQLQAALLAAGGLTADSCTTAADWDKYKALHLAKAGLGQAQIQVQAAQAAVNQQANRRTDVLRMTRDGRWQRIQGLNALRDMWTPRHATYMPEAREKAILERSRAEYALCTLGEGAQRNMQRVLTLRRRMKEREYEKAREACEKWSSAQAVENPRKNGRVDQRTLAMYEKEYGKWEPRPWFTPRPPTPRYPRGAEWVQ